MAINKRQSFRNCEVHYELKFNCLLKKNAKVIIQMRNSFEIYVYFMGIFFKKHMFPHYYSCKHPSMHTKYLWKPDVILL